jgi:glycosyltransferase involved in cell wall biosynthesis
MMPDSVSVVVPCYRQGHLLGDAIDSVVSQTYPAVEIVVVNDGSDDDTEAVAHRYGRRVRYVSQPNAGLAAARNAGIAAASGDYLLFLDADDLLDPSAIAALVDVMAGRTDRLALMGFRLFTSDPGSGEDIRPRDSLTGLQRSFDLDPLLTQPLPPDILARPVLLPYLFYLNLGPCHAWLCSRQLVLDVGVMDTKLIPGCEDWDLWIRLALAGVDLGITPHIGALYRRYPGSMSTNVAQMLDARVDVLLKACRRLRSHPDMQHWAAHLLQAARGARRRYVLHDVRSGLLERLSCEIAFLLTQTGSSSTILRQLLEPRGGQHWDRLALTYYRYVKPGLIEHYRSNFG